MGSMRFRFDGQPINETDTPSGVSRCFYTWQLCCWYANLTEQDKDVGDDAASLSEVWSVIIQLVNGWHSVRTLKCASDLSALHYVQLFSCVWKWDRVPAELRICII